MVKRRRKNKDRTGLTISVKSTKVSEGNETVSLEPNKYPATDLLQSDDAADRAFWPEFAPGRDREAVSAGRGAEYKRLADLRLAIRAVSDGFPVPRAAVERLVFDLWLQSTDHGLTLVERQRSQKLLVRMIERNLRPAKLPKQILDGSVLSSFEDLNGIELNDDDLDFRELKIVPGSADDYAD